MAQYWKITEPSGHTAPDLCRPSLDEFCTNLIICLHTCLACLPTMIEVTRFGMMSSVTSKKSPNVYKSCPKMISIEKLNILTPIQILLTNVGDLDKLIVAKGFKSCPKSNKLPNLVTQSLQPTPDPPPTPPPKSCGYPIGGLKPNNTSLLKFGFRGFILWKIDKFFQAWWDFLLYLCMMTVPLHFVALNLCIEGIVLGRSLNRCQCVVLVMIESFQNKNSTWLNSEVEGLHCSLAPFISDNK